MNITEARTQVIIDHVLKNGDYSEQYGEMGYYLEGVGILFANWNDYSQRIQDYLEAAGYALEWLDQWVIDYGHSKAYRISPNSYDWVCQVTFTDDGELLTPDSPIEDWTHHFAITDHTQPIKALPSHIIANQLKELEFKKLRKSKELSTFESGFHPGQDDQPENIAKVLFDQGYSEIVFKIESSGQFDIEFSAWARK